MKLIRLVAFVAGLGLAGITATAADWPQWRGPNRDGHSKDTGLLKKWEKEGPKLVWTFDKAGVGYSSPAVVGDKIYVLGADDADKGDKEFVLCIGMKDGKELWRQETGSAVGNYSGGWGAGPRGTPTVDGDHLYFVTPRGDLQCRKTSDGSKVWGLSLTKDLGGKLMTGWGFSESVLIDGDNLICTPGGTRGSIACLNKKDGKEIWRSKEMTDAAGYSSNVINNFGVKHYVTLLNNGVVGVRASDGKLLYKSTAGKNGTAVIPTAIVSDKYVFATSGYGSGCGLLELTADGTDSVKMKEVYLNKAIVNKHGGVILVDNFVYGSSERSGWLCLDYLKLDRDKESPAWKSNKLEEGSIAYADGCFYCYGNKGACVLLEANPKEWKELGRFDIPQKTKFPRKSGAIWTHPVVANGKLFLRDHEYIFCYDVKGLD